MHAVFLAADLNPGAREQWHTSLGPDVPEAPRPPLADGEVRFVGDPVALVVAESRYAAEDGADLVVVDYEPLPAVVDYASAEGAEASVHEQTPGNVVGQIGRTAGARAGGGPRVGAVRRDRDLPSAHVRAGADGDARARRRVVGRERRDDDAGRRPRCRTSSASSARACSAFPSSASGS